MINPKIANRVKAIKVDKIHGATWLSEEAISILSQAVQESRAENLRHFITELKEITKALAQARPDMASVANYACWFTYEVITHSQKESDLNSLKALAKAKGNEIIEVARQAVLKVARNGTHLIQLLDTIMTCSYSATVCQCLEIAKGEGEDFYVIIAESKSLGGKPYGEMTAEQLKSSGISTKVIRDDEIIKHMPEVTKVLVGADSILRDGSLINGTPTYALASAASAIHIPFYSLCQTAKFNPRNCEGKNPELEAGFDKIPPQLVTGIITEFDIISPCQVSHYTKEIKKYWQVLVG